VFFGTVICWFFIALILFTLLGGRIKSLLFKKKAAR
jgi:prolipoprotein diacylglyceryltransferase